MQNRLRFAFALALAACAASNEQTKPALAAVLPDTPSITQAPSLKHGERAPRIPPSMLRDLRGKQGVVVVRIQIEADGRVSGADIAESTLPELNTVVLDQVGAWIFEPALMDGKPTRVAFTQPFSFKFTVHASR